MFQENIIVNKTARYFRLGEFNDNTKEVWFVCHGYAELANYFIKHFDVLDDGTRVIIAPEALHRFYWKGFTGRVGASWMTKEQRDDDIKDYVNYLNVVYNKVMQNNPTIAVTILGFSQGCATASRWFSKRENGAERLILWAGTLAHDIDLELCKPLFDATKLIIVVGKNDEFFKQSQIDEHVNWLTQNEIAHELIYFNGKHSMDSDTLLKIA